MAPSDRHDDAIQDRELHQLFDGELSKDEADALRARARARGGSSARLKLEGLGEVRALVRAALEEEAGAIDAEAAWASVAARIEGADERASSSPSPKPALRVIEGGLSERDEREASTTSATRESAPAELLGRATEAPARDEDARTRERQVRTRRTFMVIVAGIAAIAAAAIAMFDRDPGSTHTPPSTQLATAVTPPDEADDELQHTEVVAVDFGSNVGAVFSVEGEEGARYAVVWLSDDEGDPSPGDAHL